MKKFKRPIVKFLSVAIFVFFASTMLVSVANNEPPLRAPYYESFSGIVKEIKDLPGIEDAAFLRRQVIVENQGGIQVNFIISKDTFFIDGDKIRVGADITGFYKANAPAVATTQYTAEIMVADTKERQIKADFFGHDLVSADGVLKLNISPESKLVWRDGTPFEGMLLGGRKLIVFYNVTTRSMPAQTVPSRVIVFDESFVVTNDNLSKMDIIVNDKKIQAAPAYLNEDKVVMVPLQPIAEALGFKVAFNAKEKKGVFGGGITFTVDEDNYLHLNKYSFQLGTAPSLIDGKVYVPLNFFTEMVRLNNAYVFENQIVINNNDEKMQ